MMNPIRNECSDMNKILIVDDDELTRSFLSKKLKIAGYSSITLDSGLDVIDKLRQNSISLVLLDILMDKKDGIETLKDIREQFHDIPVVTISTNAKYLPASIALGANAYIHKPIRMPELVGLVHSMVHH